jgi:hypothetical protein
VANLVEDIVRDLGQVIVSVHEWKLGLVPALRNTSGDVENIARNGEKVLSFIDSCGKVVREVTCLGGKASVILTVRTPCQLASAVVRTSVVVMVQDGVHVFGS